MKKLTEDKMIEFGYVKEIAVSGAIYFDISGHLRVYINNKTQSLHFIAQYEWTPFICEIKSVKHFKALVLNLLDKKL